jgi:hypothetical protein
VAEAVRSASLKSANEDDLRILSELGLLKADDSLNAEGRAFEEAWWVYKEYEAAEVVMKAALLRIPAVQALAQSLHGRGPVPVDGVVHYLASHAYVAPDETKAVRALLTVLGSAGIVSDSVKHQTVRITVPIPDDGGPEPKVRVINPDRPYTNLRHLREVLRACRDRIWWAEPHFVAKLLEPLTDEAESGQISEIKILTGAAATEEVLERGRKDFKRFRKEMKALSIDAEWRIMDGARDKHDRFVVERTRAWNMPPINTLLKGDYSQINETEPPPFEEWWAAGTDLFS